MKDEIESVIKEYFLSEDGQQRRKKKVTSQAHLGEWGHLIEQMKRAMREYPVQDFTNLENDWCCIAEILLHKGEKSFLDDDKELVNHLGGNKRSLSVFASLLTPYYYYYISEMQYDYHTDKYSFQYCQPTELELEEVVLPVKSLLEANGYHQLSNQEARAVISGVKTECLEEGEVTVFHCLFSELFSPH